MTATLCPGSTPKYSVELAAIRLVFAVAVGLAPKDTEQIASVCSRTTLVAPLNAADCRDPAPMTTAELFDAIAHDMTGRKSEFSPPVKLTEWFLNTRISPPLTGLPHAGVPYFFISQTYDTAIADELLAPHGIVCPRFGYYVGNLLDFVEEFPQL